MSNEAEVRLKINKLLEKSGWRLLEDENGPKIENRINKIWGEQIHFLAKTHLLNPLWSL